MKARPFATASSGALELPGASRAVHAGLGIRGPGSVMTTASRAAARAAASLSSGPSDAILPLARAAAALVAPASTPESRARPRTFDSVLASFPRSQQFAIREMILDVIELEMRKETLEERLQVVSTAEEPTVLKDIRAEITDRRQRLQAICGADNFAILNAVTDRVNREEMGLVAEPDEDLALTESEARVWRRKLDSRRKNRLQGSGYVGHEHATARGKSSAWDPVTLPEERSYYEVQQLRYGRGRRGSTSYAGAFDVLFQLVEENRQREVDSASSGQGTQEEVSDDVISSSVREAVEGARAGRVEDLCGLAVDLALQLKQLQRERAALVTELKSRAVGRGVISV